MYVLVCTAVFLWGANFNLAAVVIESMPTLTAAGLRFVISALVMLALILLRREWPGYVRSITNPMVLLAGFFGIGGFNLLFFFAVQYSSPVNTSLIMAMTPLITVIIAAMVIGERPSLRAKLAIPVAMIGVSGVILGGGATGPLEAAWGDLLMFGANLTFAIYSLIARRAFPVGGPLPDAAAMVTVGAVMTGIAAIVGGVPEHLPTTRSISALLAMAIGGSVLTYVFWNEAVRRLGPSRSSLYMNLVPVCTVSIATLLGEPPTLVQLLGGSLVVGAVVWSSWPQAKVPQGAPP